MFQHLSAVLFSFFVVVCAIVAAADDKTWDWQSEKYGVHTWAQRFPLNCNGSHQSPVNLQGAIYDKDLGEIRFTNYDTVPLGVNATAQNDGHSYKVSFSGFTNITTPKISGGGLPGEFGIGQFHFHWGSNNSVGSEHLLNGKHYAAELHLVHINTKYSGETAHHIENKDGLAVLGVFIKEGKHNENFNFLNLTEHNVTYEGMESNFPFMNSLMNFLPSNKSFYRYNGSLTTPDCHEVVTWTVFDNYIEISAAQLNVLRYMMRVNHNSTIERLVDNYRPPQPLNGRLVLANFGETLPHPPATTMSTTDGANGIYQNYFMFLASLSLVLFSFFKL